MANLIYGAMMSLDGYIEDTTGGFDWAEPDDEVHAFVNANERPVGTYLYGRRMYEVMQAWEHPEAFADDSPILQDFATNWQRIEKIVYSTSLQSVSTQRTRIERTFDPEAIRRLKADATQSISIAGPGLGTHAIRAGLVDEYQFYIAPVIVGGGKPAMPADVRVDLVLVEERRFESGMVYLRYAARP